MTIKNEHKKIIALVLIFIVSFHVVSYLSCAAFFYVNKVAFDWLQFHPYTIFQYYQAYQKSPDMTIRFSVVIGAMLPFASLFVIGFIALLGINKRALHGDARFASVSEAKKAGLINPKEGLEKTILVGKYKGNYLTYAGYQFVMLAAPSRSGKGVGVVIPNCLNYSDSLVVLDIKFENYDITSGFRSQHGQEVYLFAPFGRFNENEPIENQKFKTHRWNPLDYVSTDPASRVQDIDAIGTALYSSKDDKDAFWNDMAKDLFRGLCLMVLETEGIQHTLGEILRQASGKGKTLPEHVRDMMQAAADKGKPYSNACTDALNRIINSSDNTLNNILNTFNAKLLTFANPRVDAATSASDFDLRQIRRKKMTIYLGVSPNDLGQAAFIVNLFFDQLINLNTRTLPQQDKTLKYQCLMIMDEFTSIGKVEMIHKSISYQAGYNMRVLTIIQNKSQLEDVYGKSGALTLMSNHALMIMYAPSPVVQTDANEYSEMLGYQTVKSTSHSKQHGKNMSNSESISDQKRALMLPQEIKELGRWREIVSLENCKPILCDKIKYFKDPAFTKRCKLPVAPIPALDMNLFMSKIESRKRDIEEQDLSPESLDETLEHLFADEDLAQPPKALENFDFTKDFTDEDYKDLVDDTAEEITESVLKPAIDKDKFKLDESEAKDVTDNLFSEDSDENELVELSDDETTTDDNEETDNTDNDTLDVMAKFGFLDDVDTVTEDTSETEDNSDSDNNKE